MRQTSGPHAEAKHDRQGIGHRPWGQSVKILFVNRTIFRARSASV